MAAMETLQKIIGLDEQIAVLKEEFGTLPKEEQQKALTERFNDMLGALDENAPVSMGLVRVTEMLLFHGNDWTTQLLGKGLGHPNQDVRLLCGDAILHLAEEGIELIMPVVEDALANGGILAEEMPFLLTDVDHPDVPRVLERFLEQDSNDIVAAAIEALAEYGDPSCLAALEKLKDDARTVSVEEDGSKMADWTIGQLAKDAVEMLTDKED
ncbi:MAG: hypothetical protein GY854_17545 [Deltaproteobacteria bacterium]|nr:hypothetical protein [Deltaproteobacteria bacterium]